MQIEVLSFAGGDLEAAADDHITSIAVSDNTGWEELLEVDPQAIEESEHAAIKRLTSSDQGTGSGRDRRPQSFQVRSAVSRRPGAQGEDETRLGTKRRFPPFAPVAAPDRGENDRLPEVHNRGPAFCRHFSARAILRRWDAFAFRLRAKRCRAALWPNECARRFAAFRQGTAARLAG